MHDLTDDDRARLEEVALMLDGMEGGTAIFSPGFRSNAAFLRKLAEQSSGDQGVRERVEGLERFEPYAGEPREVGGPLTFRLEAEAEMDPDSQGEWLRRSDVLAALSDSTDQHEEVEVIPADSPQVLSVEEALRIWKVLEESSFGDRVLSNRLFDWATGESS